MKESKDLIHLATNYLTLHSHNLSVQSKKNLSSQSQMRNDKYKMKDEHADRSK